MYDHSFGKRSSDNLNTCHQDLIEIANYAIRISAIDFGITQGGRTVEQQQDYFNDGKSRINPKAYATPADLAKVAKHIVVPGHDEFCVSRAFDVHIYIPGRKELTYDPEHLTYVAGIIMASAHFLKVQGRITRDIRWGGNWDSDGIILRDQSLWDRPHFELI